MSTNVERANSLHRTLMLLYDLQDSKKTPRVPQAVRDEAGACLRHFPAIVTLGKDSVVISREGVAKC